jgi:hypothetical protein
MACRLPQGAEPGMRVHFVEPRATVYVLSMSPEHESVKVSVDHLRNPRQLTRILVFRDFYGGDDWNY